MPAQNFCSFPNINLSREMAIKQSNLGSEG
jgi:hypothetical protein